MVNTISVIDPGTPIDILMSYTNQNHEFTTHHKFAWASSLLLQSDMSQKIAYLKGLNIEPYCGGSLFELAFLRGELDELSLFLKKHNFDTIEISSGSIDISEDELKKSISKFAKDFNIIVEVGKKNQEKSEGMYPEVWVHEINMALNCGASTIVLEGRESGNSGIFRSNGELRKGLLLEIARHCPIEKLIFECSRKEDQITLIDEFGDNIGFGNISLTEVASLWALLQGLRGDTITKNTGIKWQN